jgi:phosphate transport system permease protein
MTESNPPAPPADFDISKRRMPFLGLTLDDVVKAFFGGNALVSVVVLALITVFLFREGVGFFGQNRQNIAIYRHAGLEYVDFIRAQQTEHGALIRSLADLRLRYFTHLTQAKHFTPAAANEALASYDEFANKFADSADALRGFLGELTELATGIKTKFLVTQDQKEARRMFLAAGKTAKAAQVQIVEVDFAAELQPLRGTLAAYRDLNREFATKLTSAIAAPPELPTAELRGNLERFSRHVRDYVAGFPAIEQNLSAWDHTRPIPIWQAFTSFLFGREWLTASFWQDWYGLLPLFTGSLLVSLVALALAVPFGVGAAIYVNQIASPAEQKFIKPCIEFVAAFPSVVLGFFGIAVLGELLRALSQVPALAWVPGFPYSERLNVLTAGCLLALIAVPTIFTLAEDALNNVPRSFKEASFALGASRLQTIVRIVVPASLPGIVSAVLLGLGRVIGETMVVLLCAGNRIAIPDFTAGLGVVTQPVHTMTGIIAQEMGEVGPGSIHWRALFMVGLVLFFLSLLINYAAQKIVRRYRIPIG